MKQVREIIAPSVSFFIAGLAVLVVFALGVLLDSLSQPGARPLPLSSQPPLAHFLLTHQALLRTTILAGMVCSALATPLTVVLLLRSETPSWGRFPFRDQVRGLLPLLGAVLLLGLACVGLHGLFRLHSFGPRGSVTARVDRGIELIGALAAVGEVLAVIGFGLLFSAFELSSRLSSGRKRP